MYVCADMSSSMSCNLAHAGQPVGRTQYSRAGKPSGLCALLIFFIFCSLFSTPRHPSQFSGWLFIVHFLSNLITRRVLRISLLVSWSLWHVLSLGTCWCRYFISRNTSRAARPQQFQWCHGGERPLLICFVLSFSPYICVYVWIYIWTPCLILARGYPHLSFFRS